MTRKAIYRREIHVIKQVTQGSTCYLLDGVSKALGQPLTELGAKWIPGRPGIWEIPSHVAEDFLNRGALYTENIDGQISTPRG